MTPPPDRSSLAELIELEASRDGLTVLSVRERTDTDPPDYPRYIVCFPGRGLDLFALDVHQPGHRGEIRGGDDREEAVFWGEREARNSGFLFRAPDGWEDVPGSVPDVDGSRWPPRRPGRRSRS